MSSAGLPYGLQSLLKEGHRHLSGLEESVLRNIDAVKQLSKITRTSLGPNGTPEPAQLTASPRPSPPPAPLCLRSPGCTGLAVLGCSAAGWRPGLAAAAAPRKPASLRQPYAARSARRAGMNKMVINHLEKLFVTSDAATIVKELEVAHPAARLVVLAAQAQEAEIGDGTNLARRSLPCCAVSAEAGSRLFRSLASCCCTQRSSSATACTRARS